MALQRELAALNETLAGLAKSVGLNPDLYEISENFYTGEQDVDAFIKRYGIHPDDIPASSTLVIHTRFKQPDEQAIAARHAEIERELEKLKREQKAAKRRVR